MKFNLEIEDFELMTLRACVLERVRHIKKMSKEDFNKEFQPLPDITKKAMIEFLEKVGERLDEAKEVE
jgi:hypothetical protein